MHIHITLHLDYNENNEKSNHKKGKEMKKKMNKNKVMQEKQKVIKKQTITYVWGEGIQKVK